MARGGARRGAGRKKKNLHLDDFKAVGPPPLGDALKLAEWNVGIIAIEQWRTITGRADEDLGGMIRSNSNALVRGMPFERMVAAEGVIRGDSERLKERAAAAEMKDVSESTEVVGGAPPRGQRHRRSRPTD